MENSRKDSKSGMKNPVKTQKSNTSSRGKNDTAKSIDSKRTGH